MGLGVVWVVFVGGTRIEGCLSGFLSASRGSGWFFVVVLSVDALRGIFHAVLPSFLVSCKGDAIGGGLDRCYIW